MAERSTDNRVIQVQFLVEPPFLNNKYKYNKMFNKFFKSSSNNVLSTGTRQIQVNGRTISVQGDLVIVDGKRIDLPETKVLIDKTELESLRKNSRNFYQFSNGGLLPTIIDNNQPEYLRKPIGDTSRRAKMIYTFETISPRELLINKNNGNEPTRRDLKLIEDLLVDYKLKPGVVNVLLDYAINVNNKKLTRGFVETIAGEWQRKGIETVEDAMNNCEKVHKKSSKRNYKDDNVNMKTPDWFDKEIDKSNVSDGEENQLEELLKEYK